MKKVDNKTAMFKYEFQSGLLSVIALTYKQKDFFWDTLSSILNQDYPWIELIVSDDGTPDYDETVVAAYIEKNKQSNLQKYTILHNKTNLGTVRNINGALRQSHGEYIKIIGGDDTYPIPGTFSHQVALLKSSNSKLATVGMAQQCDYWMHPISDERVDKSNRVMPNVLSMDYIEARKYISKNDIFPIAIQAVCYRRAFFEKKGFCDEDYVLIDDAPSVLMILEEAKNIIPDETYTVNHRSNVGISTSIEFFSPRRILYYQDCVTYCKKEICTHPEIYDSFTSRQSLRLNTFVYLMTKAKIEQKSFRYKFLLLISYCDAIVFYFANHPKKIAQRIVRKFSKKSIRN